MEGKGRGKWISTARDIKKGKEDDLFAENCDREVNSYKF